MSTRSSNASSPTPEASLRARRLAATVILLALATGSAAAQDKPQDRAVPAAAGGAAASENAAPKEIAPTDEQQERMPAPLDPVTEVVEGDALTQIRIAAISFQNQKNLGQALSGVIGAFLRRDRLKDATVDLTVIHDPVWRATALLHFAEYHYARGELNTVNELLRKVETLTADLSARPEEEAVLSLVSQRQAEYGNFVAARRTADRIPSPFVRIAKLLEIADLQAGDFDKKKAALAVENLRLAFNNAKTAKVGQKERLNLLLTVANHAITLRFNPFAREVLESGYTLLAKTPFDGSTPIIAEFAAGMVRAGERGRAMEIVRSMKNDIRHAYSLASVARAFADTGSIEGAVPLFYLALQAVEGLEDPKAKVKVLTHIIKEQTRAGRLADAFNVAGKISDMDEQRAALFAMATILLENNQPLEALKLVDYLPDMGMRAQILTQAARHYYVAGDRKQAAALMLKAVRPTGTESSIETLAAGVPLIFEAQVEMGKGTSRDEVFDGARALLDLIPNEPVKVPVMTRIARAEMRDGQKDASDRSLGMAWRIAWFNKEKKVFPQLLTDIAMAQLNIGELLLAFDTAARISENPAEEIGALQTMYDRRESPKMRALTAIAIAAARQGEGQLALRAARTISDMAGRASAYREVALAFPVSSQEAKLGKGVVPLKPGPNVGNDISPAVKGAPVPAVKR